MNDISLNMMTGNQYYKTIALKKQKKNFTFLSFSHRV